MIRDNIETREPTPCPCDVSNLFCLTITGFDSIICADTVISVKTRRMKPMNSMKIGVLVGLSENIDKEFEKLRQNGFDCCQIYCWNMNLYTDSLAKLVNESVQKYNIEITALWCGWGGPKKWNFDEGYNTLGLVPEKYRSERVEDLKRGSDFARLINVKYIITHAGFLPESPAMAGFESIVDALVEISKHCKQNGQHFLFETGQETPVALRRIIESVGMDNVGVNLDPANLIMYGKANPVDAITVLSKYIRDVHGKDGNYPTDANKLGEEMPLGEGSVNYPAFISKLKETGYDGPITIEREISGDKQLKDILKAKELLMKLIGENDE